MCQFDFASINKRPINLKLRSLEEADGPKADGPKADRLRDREELPGPSHLGAETLWPTLVVETCAETLWPKHVAKTLRPRNQDIVAETL